MSFVRSYSDDTLHTIKQLGSTPAAATTNDLVMRNAFLIFRLVFLAILTNLAFLTLVFASWNISSTVSAGLPATSTSIFIILQSCLVFFCVFGAVVDFFRPRMRTSRTALECAWVGVLGMLQMATAISSSISGFAVSCRATAEWNVCASASLLMPLTWLSCILTLAYFMALFVTALAHTSLYSDIWKRSVYDVEWFGQPTMLPSKEKVVQDFLQKSAKLEEDPYADFYDDIESTAGRKKLYLRDSIGEEVAPWAAAAVRRGVDPPFARRPGHGSQPSTSLSSSSSHATPVFAAFTSNTPPLSMPHRSATTAGMSTRSGSRFIEKFRESSLLARKETPSQYVEHFYAQKDQDEDRSSFPKAVADVDQPIPLPRLSEWVKADALNIPGMTASATKPSGHKRTGSKPFF